MVIWCAIGSCWLCLGCWFWGYDLVCALVLFVVLCLEFGVLHLVGRLVWVCWLGGLGLLDLVWFVFFICV